MEGAVLEMRGRLIKRPDEHGMTIRDTKKSHHSMGTLYKTTRKDDFHHSKETVPMVIVGPVVRGAMVPNTWVLMKWPCRRPEKMTFTGKSYPWSYWGQEF